ncbi:unnamed protein product [Rotaria sp. Silwood2]|nr:unnamed protein product [Rotaria sp. Silwood2]CAF4271473.1 unnamed protein product [Rotaria sp. Silwood2]CAF4353922.1 unnamed protein product [Rotaria sp. Silwood2]
MNNSSSNSINFPPSGGGGMDPPGGNGGIRPPAGGGGMGPPGGGGGMGPPPDFGSISITAIQRNLVFYGYILLFLFGFFGHAASATIFLRRTLRTVSTSCLFVCMAGSDTIYLLMCIYDFIFLGLGVPTTNINLMNALCRFRSFVQYFSMCYSAWLLLSITIDRWLRVQFPFRVKELCTTKRVLIGAFIILMFSVTLNSHLLLPSLGVVPGAIACAPGPMSNPTYQYFYMEIWPFLITSLQIILPTILLLIFSIKIFLELRRQQQKKHQLKQGHRRTFLDRQILIIMLTSIFLFFVTQIPLSLFYILMSSVLRNELGLEQLLQLNTIVTFVASINYAASFYIHCLSSRLFREECFNVIHCKRHQRVGVITQMLGLEGSHTQTQLFHWEGGKSTKA